MQQIMQGRLGLTAFGLFAAILYLAPAPCMAQEATSIWMLNAQNRTIVEYCVRFGDALGGNVPEMSDPISLPVGIGTPVGLGIAGPPDTPSSETGLCGELRQPTGRLFVADGIGTISEINPVAPNDPPRSIPTDVSSIAALAYSGAALYLLNTSIQPPTMTRVDPAMSMPSVSCSMNVAMEGLTTFTVKPILAGGGDQLFTVVTAAEKQHIVALDTAFDMPTCEVVANFPAFDTSPVEEPIVGLAFNGRRLFVATETGKVYEGDASTGLSLRNAATGDIIPPQLFQIEGGSPTAIVSQVVSSVFTMDLQSVQPECAVQPGRIVEFDTVSGQMMQQTICLPERFIDNAGLAYSGRSLFFVNGSNPSTVYELSLTTGTSLKVFAGPPARFGIEALAFADGFLYALDSINDSITTIDPRTGLIVNTPCITGLIAESALSAGRLVRGQPSLLVGTAAGTIAEIGRDDCTTILGPEFNIMSAQNEVQTLSGLAFDHRRLFAGSMTDRKIFAYALDDNERWVNTGASFPAHSPFSFAGLASTRVDAP